MVDRRTSIAIRVLHAPNHIATIKAFRVATSATINAITTALTQQTLIEIGHVFDLDHDEVEVRLLVLLRELDELGTRYNIVVAGEIESRENLNDQLQHWREIEKQTQSMIELEIGEPGIETLEWLRRGSPDVFRDTLRQIVNGDGYHVDPETLQWVNHQLDDSA